MDVIKSLFCCKFKFRYLVSVVRLGLDAVQKSSQVAVPQDKLVEPLEPQRLHLFEPQEHSTVELIDDVGDLMTVRTFLS